MRSFLSSFVAALAIGSGAAGGAASPAHSVVEARFQALVAEDRFHDTAGAVERWRALIDAARADRDTPSTVLAQSYGWLAWTLDYVDQTEPALVAAETAQQIVEANRLGDQPVAAEVTAIHSMILTDLGKTDAGIELADKALAISKRLPDGIHAVLAHNAAASAAYSRAHYEEAAKGYEAAAEVAMRQLAPSNPFIVNEMASHAGVLYMLGRNEEALEVNERAASWALGHLPENSPVITLALGNLGVMLRSAGRYPEAEVALRRVVDLEARYQKESYYYRAISLSNFASVIDRQGRHREAEALWLKSSEFHKLATVKRDPVQPAYPLRFSADAAQARGDLALALERRAEGLRLVENITPPDHPELARARIEYGLTLTLMHRAKEGLAFAEPAVAVVQAKLQPDDVKRLTAEIDHARIVAAVSGADAGYRLVEPIALRLEARLLDASTSRGDLLRFGPVFSSSFATVTDLALATGRDEQAFHWLQLANLSDIVLVSTDVAARAAIGSAAAPLMRDLQDRVRQRQSLDRARSFAAASSDPAELARLEAAIQANDGAIARAAHRLDAAYPTFQALGRPVPVALDAFRARLTPSQILVAPMPLDDGTLSITVTRDGLRWSKSPTQKWSIAEWVGQVRASIDDARSGSKAPFAWDAAARLYAGILPPANAQTFAAHAEMLYYASGALATLPPALLIAPDKDWLLASHNVTILPTLQPGESRRDARGATFLGIGAPAAPTGSRRLQAAGLPALPQAAREIRRMASALGGSSTLLMEGEATESALKMLPLNGFATIAIATHALGGGDLAGLSEPALVMTPPAQPDGQDDGLLTASEIAGLRLDADWVILSACDTASGLGTGSPAYSGLASAFMAAGAKALLVSHWPVRDDAAEALTVATLKGARAGLSRAEALRRAMLALQRDRRVKGSANPAIWAPFVLIDR